nr:GTPase [Streptomyces qinglanensis]
MRRDPRCDAGESVLRQRLGALRELVGLSRTRLDADVLAEAGTVLDEAATRRSLPRSYTTVALAGATGSGKSSLFNALTGGRLSEVGMRRPTTAAPVACTWEAGRYSDGSPDGLLDRLGIPQHARHRTHDGTLSGLVLVDLPDHDSAAPGHREQVDRMLELVDAVVWVVDPEKYADALLHEDYLRRLAGHAEVTFVVLNQTDRLTRDSVDAVLDDLRRLLDEDGMALGEHGEPGAVVLSASALTHEGIDVLREELGEFVAQQRAAVLRLTADLDGAMDRLRPVYTESGPGAEGGPVGLSERAREDFEDRLAVAVGAAAAGQAAERAWLRQAEHSSGIPWLRALRWYASRPTSERDEWSRAAAVEEPDAPDAGVRARRDTLQQSLAARPVVAQAVRELADAAASGLPDAWGHTVRESARRGAAGLPEALDEVMEVCSAGPDAERTAAVTASLTDFAFGAEAPQAAKPASATAAAVPGQQSVSGAPAPRGASDPGRFRGPERRGDAAADGPDGDSGLPGAPGSPVLDGAPERTAAASDSPARGTGGSARDTAGPSRDTATAGPSPDAGAPSPDADRAAGSGARVPRPTWHTAAFAGQWLLFALQVTGAAWLAVAAVVTRGLDHTALLPGALLAAATLAGPGLAWACRRAARGPARTYGLEEERRLRQLAACCGGTRVLEPVAAELLRYRQVREQYAIAAGVVDSAAEERSVDARIGPQGTAVVGAQGGAAVGGPGGGPGGGVAGGVVGGADGRGAGALAGGPRGSFETGGPGGPGGPGSSGDPAASDAAGRNTGAGADTAGSPTGVTELCTTTE